jgi:hypothetical protein
MDVINRTLDLKKFYKYDIFFYEGKNVIQSYVYNHYILLILLYVKIKENQIEYLKGYQLM